MEYSIRELAQLSGLSTRTLRWYDEIGLLKPARVAESGYRYYGPAQVDRLQHILTYRALGLQLARIRECLDDPSFDRLAALRQHRKELQKKYPKFETFNARFEVGDDILTDMRAFADKENETPSVTPLSEDDSRSFDDLLKRIKEILGDRVTDVRISHRLADSPAVLVSPDGGMTSSMEKLFRAMHKDDSVPVKALELNRDHPLLRSLLRIFKVDPQDKALAGMAELLFEGCLLREGYVKDPQALAGHANALMEQAAAWYTEVRKI